MNGPDINFVCVHQYQTQKKTWHGIFFDNIEAMGL